MTCSNTYINPSNLDLTDIEVEGGEEGQGSGTSGRKKRRRRRSAVYVPNVRRKKPTKRLAKRQQDSTDTSGDEIDLTVNRNFVSGML